MKGPASLSGALIVTKGHAAPAGLFGMNGKAGVPTVQKPDRPAAGGAATRPALRNNHPAERSRLTLRLDPDRHLKIKLAAAHLNLSLQELMTDALDRYLADIKPSYPGSVCNCLAGHLPKSAAAKSDSGE